MVPKCKRHLAYQPVVNYGIPRCNTWEKEYKDFWKIQMRRCIKGYSPGGHAWIPGRYYFYLNFLRLLTAYGGTKRKVLDYPYYRDVDHEYFCKIEEAKKKQKGIIVLKSRRKGATMANIGGVCVYEMTIPKGNEIGLGCFSEDQVNAFRSRFEDMYSTIPDFFKQERIRSNADIIKFGKTMKVGGIDTEVGSKNTMYYKDFFNKTGAFRGHSLSFLLFEEAGENPLLKNSFLVSEECFKEGSYQFGTPIIFGTSNQINNGLKDLEEMYFNSDKYNLLRYFIPASKVYFPFFDTNNGKSDDIGAKKDIMERREVKKSMEDKIAFYTYLQEMPLVESDCFMLGASGVFDLDKIHTQIERIEDSKSIKGMVQPGILEWEKDCDGKYTKDVKWTATKNGKMLMLYPPLEKRGEMQYVDVGGVDPYRKAQSQTSDSRGSLHVLRGVANLNIPDNMPIFEYYDRPDTKEEFYENCAKVAIWYNIQLLVEDTDEEFFTWFLNNGLSKYLKPAPIVYKTVFTKASNRYGYNMSGMGKKEKIVGIIHDYIKTNCDKIYYLKLLKEFTVFGLKNTDRVISFGLSLIHAADNIHLNMNRLKNSEIEPKPIKYPGLKQVNGNIVPIHINKPEYGREKRSYQGAI